MGRFNNNIMKNNFSNLTTTVCSTTDKFNNNKSYSQSKIIPNKNTS